MVKIKFLYLGVFAMGLAACSSQPDFVLDTPYQQHEIKDQMVKPELPKAIVDKVLAEAPEGIIDKKILSRRISNHLKRAYVEIYLNEERGSPFAGANKKLILKGGAGEIDLADIIVAERPASFYLGINLVRPETENYHIYFLNEAKQRKIDGKTVGVECGDYVDLSEINKRLFERDGLLALTGDARHVTLLSGIYYIIAFSDEDVYVSHFRIKDSRFPSLSCVR